MPEYPNPTATDAQKPLPDGRTVDDRYSAALRLGSAELQPWRDAQDAIRDRYVDPVAAAFAEALHSDFTSFETPSVPVYAGDRMFSTVVPPGATRPNLMMRTVGAPEHTAEVLIEKMAVSAVPGARGWYPSPLRADGRQLIAYSDTGGGGGETRATMIVKDVVSGDILGTFEHAGYAGADWAPDGQSFVMQEMFPPENEEDAKRRKFHFRLAHHEVHGGDRNTTREVRFHTPLAPYNSRQHPAFSPDGRFLVAGHGEGGAGAGSGVQLLDRESGEAFMLQPNDGVTGWEPRWDRSGKLWLWTNHGNGFGKLLTLDVAAGHHIVPEGTAPLARAVEAVAEDPALLLDSFTVLDAPGQPTRVAAVMVDRGQVPRLRIMEPGNPEPVTEILGMGDIKVHDEAGNYLGNQGEFTGLSYNPAQPDRLQVGFTDAVSLPDLFDVDVRTGEHRALTDNSARLRERIELPSLQGTMLMVPSADGTVDIPALLVSHTEPSDRIRPTVSLAYGAFGGFDALAFKRYNSFAPKALAAGANIIVAAPRGGSELGRTWREQGLLDNWLNTVEDRATVERAMIDRGLATAEGNVRLGASAAGPDLVQLALRYPELAALTIAVNPAAGFLDSDMYGFNRRYSEYGNPFDPEQLRLLVARDPEQTALNTPPEQAERMGALLVSAATDDDRVSPKATMWMTAALQDMVRGLPDAGPVIFHGSNGGHAWTPTNVSVVLLGTMAHFVGRDALPGLGRFAAERGLEQHSAAERGLEQHSTTDRGLEQHSAAAGVPARSTPNGLAPSTRHDAGVAAVGLPTKPAAARDRATGTTRHNPPGSTLHERPAQVEPPTPDIGPGKHTAHGKG